MCEFYEMLGKSCDFLKDSTIPRIELIIKEKKEAKKFLTNEKAKYDQNLKIYKDNAERHKANFLTTFNYVSDLKIAFMEARKFAFSN